MAANIQFVDSSMFAITDSVLLNISQTSFLPSDRIICCFRKGRAPTIEFIFVTMNKVSTTHKSSAPSLLYWESVRC